MEGEGARAALAEAHRLHSEDRIEAAIAAARRALDLDPDYVNALSYLGSTLVTRKRDYESGLAILERARDLAGDDPYVRYTLGWCYEYAAHELATSRRGAHEPRSSGELYALAIEELRACLDSEPDPDLRGDAEKLLEHIEDRLAK